MSDVASEAMYYFRYYLETKGSNLSHMPDILPYFALPYVHNPRDHPSFKDLFDVIQRNLNIFDVSSRC